MVPTTTRQVITTAKLDAQSICDLEASMQPFSANLSLLEGPWSLRVEEALRPADVLRLGEMFRPAAAMGPLMNVRYIDAPVVQINADGTTEAHLRLKWGAGQALELFAKGAIKQLRGNQFQSRISSVRARAGDRALPVRLPPRQMTLTYVSPRLLVFRDRAGIVDVLERTGANRRAGRSRGELDVDDVQQQMDTFNQQLDQLQQQQAGMEQKVDAILASDANESQAVETPLWRRVLRVSKKGGVQRSDLRALRMEIKQLQTVVDEHLQSDSSEEMALKVARLEEHTNEMKAHADNLFNEQMALQRTIGKEQDKAHVMRKEILGLDRRIDEARSQQADEIAALQDSINQLEQTSMRQLSALEEAIQSHDKHASQLSDKVHTTAATVDALQRDHGAVAEDLVAVRQDLAGRDRNLMKAAQEATASSKALVEARLSDVVTKLDSFGAAVDSSEEVLGRLASQMAALVDVRERIEKLEKQTVSSRKVRSDLPKELTKMSKRAEHAKEQSDELTKELREVYDANVQDGKRSRSRTGRSALGRVMDFFLKSDSDGDRLR